MITEIEYIQLNDKIIEGITQDLLQDYDEMINFFSMEDGNNIGLNHKRKQAAINFCIKHEKFEWVDRIQGREKKKINVEEAKAPQKKEGQLF